MNKQSKIYIAGHTGMVGSAIRRKLEADGYENIIGKTLEELDLTRQAEVEAYFERERPEYVFDVAARVGGIYANDTYRAEFIYQNLQIQNNIIHSAYMFGVKKLLFLGSSCIYPKLAPQPMKEEYLLTGELEQTNEPYAIAKIAGIKVCESYRRQYGVNFISAMPTNLYGFHDNFDLKSSHVLPALLRKFHLAKLLRAGDFESLKADIRRHSRSDLPEGVSEGDIEATTSWLGQFGISGEAVEIWGTGSPKREFLNVDDAASASVFMMLNYDEELFLNVGSGVDQSIRELAEMIRGIVGFEGELRFNSEYPDGTPKKLLDVSRLHDLGWKPSLDLPTGIRNTYEWYLAQNSR